MNFFSPQQKLVSKTRRGARVTRRYDRAATPLQRLTARDDVNEATKANLMAIYRDTNPVAVTKAIGRLQRKLIDITVPAVGAAPHARTMDHPWKADRRTFSVRQRTDLKRTS